MKIFQNMELALKGVLRNNMTIMAGGFGLCGIPEHAIRAIYDSNVTGLTIISNNCGTDESGLGILLKKKQIKKFIGSYPGANKEFARQTNSGVLNVELIPQGTLVEAIRCGGAGIPAFFTRAGVGTVVAEGKETKEFGGKVYLLERSLTADVGLIKAWKADHYGNIVYRKTARNLNPLIATATKLTIAEVEELVETGSIEPDHIHTPSIFIHRVVVGANFEKEIEHITLRSQS